MIWRLNMNNEFISSIDIDYPQFVARWLRISEKITNALQWLNGRTYFFSHTSYYRYDHTHQQVKLRQKRMHQFLFEFNLLFLG